MSSPDFSRRVPSITGRYLLPLYSNVLSSDSEMHLARGSEKAFDITAHNKLTDMRPIADGTVFHIERLSNPELPGAGGYGENLIINHGDLFCWYCHLEFGSIRSDIKVGTKLRQNEVFARVGATGLTGFPKHTHLTFFPRANNYTRIAPENIWDVDDLCMMPFATSNDLDKYEVGMNPNTILSVYMQGRGNGGIGDMNYLQQLRPRVVKIQDTKQEEIDAIRSLTPESFIINRIYIDDGDVNAAIKADPEGAAEEHHNLILSKNLTGVDFYQIQNEQLQHPPDLQLLNRYYVRLINLAVQAGYKTTVIDCSVGNLHVGEDHAGDWPIVYPALELAQAHGFPVNCHQYSKGSFWNPEWPNEWYLHRLELTAMKQLDLAGFTNLRYVIGEFGLTNMLGGGSPGGWQTWKSHDEYRTDLINIMSYLVQWSDRILGYCCYLTHALSPWETHEMIEMNNDLADHYAENPQNIKPLVDIGEGGAVLFEAIVTTNTLNVRSGPPINGVMQPIIGRIHLGDIVDVYNVADRDPDDWWEIKLDDLRGWSSSGYMDKIEEEKTLEERVEILEVQTARQGEAIKALSELSVDHSESIARLTQSVLTLDQRVTALEDGGGVTPPPGDTILAESISHMGMSVQGANADYLVSKVFTTWRGQWPEPSQRTSVYDVEGWARARYLYPPDHPNYHDDGGGDHHLFVRVEDDNGLFIPGVDILFTSINEGVDPTTRTTSTKHGWCNIPIFHPAMWYAQADGTGQHMSAYTMPNADGSMPGREHVSLFMVLRAV